MNAFFSYVFKRVKCEHEWTRAKSNYNEMTTNWSPGLLQGFRATGTYRDVVTAHCKTLLYIALYEFAASGGKLRSSLAKNLVSFLAWVKVGSLQDIAVNDEGGKTLQKRDLQY